MTQFRPGQLPASGGWVQMSTPRASTPRSTAAAGGKWVPTQRQQISLQCPSSVTTPIPVITASPFGGARPRVQGKFLFVGQEKLYLRGVTYGPFRPEADGSEYHDRATAERDFAAMAASGVNAIRTYTVPPRWLLDAAQRHGLWVMVGLAWEQHIAFLDGRKRSRGIEGSVAAGVRACAGHPAVLAYAIGNEIPASLVRWYGRQRIEAYLKRLYRAAKNADPDGLVTYVNYPSTEYLHLPFVDYLAYNVYLESREQLEGYVARLQNIAGDRPLVLAEIGMDSRRHGEAAQADALGQQLQTAFAAGCAGTFVFSWTDEWHRGGYEIEHWDFGLTDRQRRPKAALETVRRAFDAVPFPTDLAWPRISVVVCSYNGERTIRDCLEGLAKLEYPDFEVIVVDDGSTDATPAIAREFGVRVISTENRGLSSARNTGMVASTGEVIAYTDDDARPDPHWLHYLAYTFMTSKYAAVGGPNIAPREDGLIAECVANAPGGPIHVLVSDTEAEHIPGCNMAVRKRCLEAIGGFDPQFRVAGDDVDVCWRLQQQGWRLGFHPAAMVWHHRRNSVRAYWRQQQGYGKAEALLERKWPEKYNAAGHLIWSGRLYSKGLTQTIRWTGERIHHGTWGTALFQSLYQPAPGLLMALPVMPEWYLVMGVLAAFSVVGLLWKPLLLALPLCGLALGITAAQAVLSAARASFLETASTALGRWQMRTLTAVLHGLQPLARLSGRLRHGLSPWRSRRGGFTPPWPRTAAVWSERWQAPEAWLQCIEGNLRADGVRAQRGSEYDRWELQVAGGILGSSRLRMAIEEHGEGRQILLFRVWPRVSHVGLVLVMLPAALSTGAALAAAWAAAIVLGVAATLLSLRLVCECAGTAASLWRAAVTPQAGVAHVEASAGEATVASTCELIVDHDPRARARAADHDQAPHSRQWPAA